MEKIKTLLAEIESNVVKAEAGNKAARTRARVGLQALKAAATELRKTLLADSKA